MQLWEVASLKLAVHAGRLEILQKKSICSLEAKGSLEAESFLLRGPQSLLLRPSNDWMKPIHIMEGNLLYSKCTDLNVNHN